jgi:hypothetical protein
MRKKVEMRKSDERKMGREGMKGSQDYMMTWKG